MISTTKRWRQFFPVPMIVVMMGCGGRGDAKPIANLVPCHGTVTLDGKPLNHGTVGFAPVVANAGQPAVGAIKNGRFVMSTTVSAPGVVIGKYHVSVQSLEQETKVNSSSPTDMLKRPTSLIPSKYNEIKTSGLDVEVTKSTANVELKLVSK
jgi:hypothetical protein